MIIYGRRNSINVIPVLWATDEAGVGYERRDVGGSFGGLDEPRFLALNPNGRIPVMDDEGFVLWESNAIIRYVADLYGDGSIAPNDKRGWSRADQWMDWYKTTFYGPFVSLFQAIVKTEPRLRDFQTIDKLSKTVGELLSVPDVVLQAHDFLAGPMFSMGDIPLGTAIDRYFTLDIERPRLESLRSWHRRLRMRAAYRARVMLPYGASPSEYLALERAGREQLD